MFAVVRTGGKQYRVSAGDVITVERIKGDAGASVSLDDVLLAGDGGELKAAKDVAVSAEILEHGRGEKVVVFKKKRRHNYRRKNGHRQELTVLRITAVGSDKAESKKAAAPKKEGAPKAEAVEPAKGAEPAAADAKPEAKAPAKKAATAKAPADKPATDGEKAATAKKPAAKKPAAAKASADKPASKKSEDKDA